MWSPSKTRTKWELRSLYTSCLLLLLCYTFRSGFVEVQFQPYFSHGCNDKYLPLLLFKRGSEKNFLQGWQWGRVGVSLKEEDILHAFSGLFVPFKEQQFFIFIVALQSRKGASFTDSKALWGTPHSIAIWGVACSTVHVFQSYWHFNWSPQVHSQELDLVLSPFLDSLLKSVPGFSTYCHYCFLCRTWAVIGKKNFSYIRSYFL